jgi:hypothetical protein
MRQSSRLTLFAFTSVVLVIGALGYRYYTANPHVLTKLPSFPALPLSAGVPLSSESTSQIQVLPGQDGETPTPVTDSSHKLPSTTSITLPEPVATVTLTQPLVFDQNAAQLGTTLSLLINAWPQGGPLPRKLAEAAYQLAAKSGQMDLARAAALVRSSTPREGPITLNVLLLETSQALTLDPPANLPVNAAAAEKEKSWFRRQLEQIVTISNVPATQSRWTNSLQVVQQALVRGAVNDAAQRLESSPLSGDDRLDTLRDSVHNYLGQNGKLTQLITSYTNTYLINGNTE